MDHPLELPSHYFHMDLACFAFACPKTSRRFTPFLSEIHLNAPAAVALEHILFKSTKKFLKVQASANHLKDHGKQQWTLMEMRFALADHSKTARK